MCNIKNEEICVVTGRELSTVPYNLVLANGLIEASHDLVLNENKLINAVIAQIGMYDKEIKTFEFTTKQLQDICNLNPLHIKRTLNTIRKNLLNKTFTLKDSIERNGKAEEVTTEYHWIRYITYNDNRWIIRLSDDLAPLLLNLTKEFTSKRLSQIQTYESIYSQRLDMLFTMYFNKKTYMMSFDNKINYCTKLQYSLDEFKKLFRLEDKYSDYNNFYRFVLKPALNEINNKAYYSVSFEKKVGKNNKCEGIILFFSLGEKTIKEMREKREDGTDKLKKLLCYFSFSKKEADSILEKISHKEIENIFKELAIKKDSLSNEEQINFVKNKINELITEQDRDNLLSSYLNT